MIPKGLEKSILSRKNLLFQRRNTESDLIEIEGTNKTLMKS
jgi:hypothetical protein